MDHMIWLADIKVAKPRIIKSFGIMIMSKIDDLLNFISNHSTTHHKGQKLKKIFWILAIWLFFLNMKGMKFCFAEC